MKERPILFSAPMIRAILEGRKTQTRRVLNLPKWADPDEELEFSNAPPADWIPCAMCGDTGCYAPLTPRYGQPGDRLWVRETFTYWEQPDHKDSAPRENESSRPADGERYQRWMSRVMAQPTEGEDFILYRADGTKRSLAEWKHPHPIYEHCVGRFGKSIPAIHMHRWASRITLEVVSVHVERLADITPADCVCEGYESPPGTHYAAEELNALDWFRALWESINGPGSWAANPWVWCIEFRRIANG